MFVRFEKLHFRYERIQQACRGNHPYVCRFECRDLISIA